MRRLLIALFILACAPLARANQAVRGWCEVGAQPVVTSGFQSTTQVQQSFPQCTVTVSIHGGGTATIFSDNSGTPLANPFTATSNGQWQFYAANGRYDVILTFATNPPAPVTYSDVLVSDPANQQAAIPNTLLSFSSTPDFPSTNNSSYTLTLTGNVTSSTASGTPANGNLLSLTLIQDSTGGRTMAFPANFIQPLGFSFNTTPLATNALTWKFDGTNWNLISNTGSGGGSNPGPPQNSLQKNNGAGALAASSVIDDGTNTTTGENARFKGPNPYVDVSAFGARACNVLVAPCAAGITANMSSVTNPTQATLSSASTFVNGDGVLIIGAGAPHSMSTPSAPTVTPSVATCGTNALCNTPGPAGSTTYNYYAIARDRKGGLTTLSPVGSTTTGAATLGAQTVNITSLSASGTLVTATTSSTHGFLVGCNFLTCGEVFIAAGVTDSTFRGWFTVTSAVDGTHFTFNRPQSTLLGATSSATGGTATYFNLNKVTLSAVTGAVYFGIYSDRAVGGTCKLIGVTNALSASGTQDLTFEDFGSPMEDNQAFPAIFPASFSCASPPAATSDSLSTTIVSGAGTTTLTLANAASTTVSGTSILLDSAPGILAAAASISSSTGTLYFPSTTGGNYFVVNSWLQLNGNAYTVAQTGLLYLNDTVEVTNNSLGNQYVGQVFPQAVAGSTTGWSTGAGVTINGAHPGFFFSGNQSGLHVSHINVASTPNNGTLAFLVDGGFNQTFDWINCTTGSGLGDYTSSCFQFRASPGQANSNVVLDYVGMSPGGGGDGVSHTPTAYFRGSGNVMVPHSLSVHRGMLYTGNAGIQLGVGGIAYINGGGTPLLTLGGNFPGAVLGQVVMDTVAQPCVAGLVGTTGGTGSPSVTLQNGCSPSSGVLPVSGAIVPIAGSSGNDPSASTFSGYGAQAGNVTDSFFGQVNSNYIQNFFNSQVMVGKGYTLGIQGDAPVIATCPVSAGGSLSVGTHTFQLVPLWWNGNQGRFSTTCTATTSSGNQTVTLNYNSFSGNPQNLRIYDGGSRLTNVTGAANATSVVVSSETLVGGTVDSFATGGPTMLLSGTNGMSSPSYNMNAPGGFLGTLSSTTLTAARTHTFPDNSGTVAELNAAQTWTADQSFSNTNGIRFFSPNGTNWTKLTGPGSNPASNLTFQLPSADSTGVQCLSSNGSGVLSFSACSGGTGTPGGSTTQVQFNSAGSFGGSPNLTWVSPALTIGVNASATGQLLLANGGASGASVTVQNPSATSGYNFNLPTGAGSLGQPMLSGGGGSTAMSFGTLSVGGGGTGATTFTANQLLVGNGTSAVSSLSGSTTGTSPVLTLTSGSTSNIPFEVNTPASPTADLFDLDINSVKTSFFDSSGNLHAPQATFTGSGPFVMSGNGGTCPSPATNNYIICLGDLSSTSAQLSNNGVTFKPIVQFTNTAPTAHGVALATPTFPQISTTAAGASGVPLVGQGATSDPIFTTLGVPGGGTGATTLAAHGTVIAEGTSALTVAGPDSTSNQFLASQGASADPIFEAVPLGNSNSVSGVLAVANGGTGASSLSGASIVTVTGVITNGDCADFSAPTVITDAGAPCGAVGSVALSSITAGTASHTINSTIFPQTWNWALTGSTTGFQFGENTAATGASNIILSAHTLSTSTALPFQADNNGNGWQLSSAGQLQRLGTASLAVPGTTHGLVVSEGATGAIATPATGTAGQVLISNGSSSDPSFQDPIVSQAFVNIWTAQDVTTTRTSSNIRNPIFSQTATLQMTWAGITGSPSGCTLQIRGVDSQANVLNNGGTVSVSPANGTTSQTFTAASTLQTAAQVSVVFACSAYPSAGTLTLDFTPIPNVNLTNSIPAGSALIGKVGIDQTTPGTTNAVSATNFPTTVDTNSGNKSASTLRVVLATDQPSMTNPQPSNVTQINGNTISTAATGVAKVGVVGNAGGIVDQAPGSAVPANVVMEGLSDGTNAQRALSDTNGRQLVRQYPDTTTTSYHAAASFAGSSTTDNSVFPGNATNTAILNKITVTCTQTTAGIVTITIIKRSAADTSGTSATMTKVPDDANYAAAVSAPLTYTGTGPSVGAAIGNLDVAQFGCNASGTAGPNDIYIFRPMKPIILRGTAQQVAVNMGNAAITGGTLTVTYDWEETTTP